jgi:ribose 5-phosphate isomerase B
MTSNRNEGIVVADRWRIVVGSDEAGLAYKDALKADLEADPRVAEVIDVGVNADQTTPYPHVAVTAAHAITNGRAERSVRTRWPASARSPHTTASPWSGRC